MGLDNYPRPSPCLSLEKAGKLKVFRDGYGDVSCAETMCPFKPFSNVLGCWFRGKIYDKYVWDASEETLYEDKIREELEYILESLREYYKSNYLGMENDEDKKDYYKVEFLIRYFETLLSIEEWNGVLVAWF